MSEIISIEEYKRRKAAENMVVPCGSEKIQIEWKPKLSEQDVERLRKAGAAFRNSIKEIINANKVQLK